MMQVTASEAHLLWQFHGCHCRFVAWRKAEKFLGVLVHLLARPTQLWLHILFLIAVKALQYDLTYVWEHSHLGNETCQRT